MIFELLHQENMETWTLEAFFHNMSIPSLLM